MTIAAAAILQLIQQLPAAGELSIPWVVLWPIFMGLVGLLCSAASIAVTLYVRSMAQNIGRIEVSLEKLVVQGAEHSRQLARIDGQGLEGRMTRVEGVLLGRGGEKRDGGE